jgi:hypothetical protein
VSGRGPIGSMGVASGLCLAGSFGREIVVGPSCGFPSDGIPGVTELRVERIQDTPLSLFAALGSGDIFFVDRSHTVKTGGDVTWIYHEILPGLAPGALVHIHDFFCPRSIPSPGSWRGGAGTRRT